MRMPLRLGIVVCVAVAAPAAFSQLDDQQPFPAREEKGPQRKTPSLFHRPALPTASEQIAFAGELLAQARTGSAARAYLAVVHQWHDSPEAPRAQLASARLLYDSGHYRRAFDEFQYLVDFFPGLFPYDEAIDRQFRIANRIRTQEHRGFLFFPSYVAPERALPLFEQVLKNAPQGEHADESQFLVGTIHEGRREDEQAALAFETLRQRYPGSEFLAEAGFRAALAHLRIAGSVPRDERVCRSSLSILNAFLSEHRDHPGAAEIRAGADGLRDKLAAMYYDRALFYDRRGNKPRAAIIAYSDFLNNFPTSSKAEDVRKRIAELEAELETRK
jgi:outer membrane protein assembly factor BamD (BamD/ComL family)